MFRKILLVVAVFFLLSGCADQTKDELFKEGLKNLNENNPRGAVVLFKNVLEKDPNFFEARFQLARAYNIMGNYSPAEKELKKVIRQNPSLREAHVELARIYLHNSKPDDAINEIAKFVEEGDAEAFEIAGLAHAIKGEYHSAAEFLKKSAAGGDKTAGVALARVYMKMGRTAEARSQISEVMKEEPSRDALHVLAKLQADENDTVAAIQSYERIIDKYPSDIEASYRKGMLHIRAGQYEEALSIAEGLISSFSRRPEGHRLKGIALLYGKDLDGAIVALQKSLAIQPDPGAHYFLALCHYYEREPEQATTQLYRAIDLNPSFVQARVLASLILLQQKRVDDSITEIKRALEIDERNAFAHNILGSAYMAKGIYEEGLQELNRAVEIDPALVEAHIKKGLFSLGAGETERAEAELRNAVEAAPELLNSRVILASYYVRQGAYDKAVEVLNEGINGGGGDAVLHNILAEVLLKKNNVPAAVEHLKKAKDLKPDYYASYFNLAMVYFAKGTYEDGILELKSVIERSPETLKALLGIASILEKRGEDSEALKYYIQAKETGKPGGYIALAQYHLRKNDPASALKDLEEAISKSPDNALPYELKGKVLLSLKRYEDAIKAFEDLKTIDSTRALSYIANTYLSMDKPKKALGRVKDELREDPDRVDLMALVSKIYMAMGMKQEAAENAERIMAKKPESPVGYVVLAKIRQDSGKPDRAEEVLKQALEPTNGDIHIYMALGNLYALKGESASALAVYKKVDEIRPGYIPSIFQQGALLHSIGDREGAVIQYSKVLALSTNYVPALNNLAYLYAEDDRDMDKALQLSTRAYVLAPGDGSVNDTVGFVLLKNGKIEEALKALKRAVKLLPDNPSVHYHLALAYKASGDKAKAIENLDAALGLGAFPEKGDARTLLGQLKRK